MVDSFTDADHERKSLEAHARGKDCRTSADECNSSNTCFQEDHEYQLQAAPTLGSKSARRKQEY